MTANSTPSAPPQDDFIPAPDGAQPAAQAEAAVTNVVEQATQPVTETATVGQTTMILALVAAVALAGLLLLVRGAVRKSLIANRAPIDAANTAAWAWYLTLLVFGLLMIAGFVTGQLASLTFIGVAVVALVVGIVISLRLMARARNA